MSNNCFNMFNKNQLLKQFELHNDEKSDIENIKIKNNIIKEQPKIQKNIKVKWYLGNNNINEFRLR